MHVNGVRDCNMMMFLVWLRKWGGFNCTMGVENNLYSVILQFVLPKYRLYSPVC